jgi:hypothetical protein
LSQASPRKFCTLVVPPVSFLKVVSRKERPSGSKYWSGSPPA